MGEEEEIEMKGGKRRREDVKEGEERWGCEGDGGGRKQLLSSGFSAKMPD